MKAIILAAGMGTRLRPLTEDRPKSLVEVSGEAMTERQIRFLKEKGIHDITLVVGYKKEYFDYLVEKYGVKTVFNDKFDIYNNIYSMYLVRNILPESYVLEGDVYMNKNIIDENVNRSTYFSSYKDNFQNEWKLVINDNHKLERIDICDGHGYIMCGVSYWAENEGKYIKNELDKLESIKDFENMYWDDIVRNNVNQLDIHIKALNENDLMEIDSISDLEKVEAFLEKNK